MKLIPHTFLRNVALVTASTACGQAITIIFTPLITRLYGPEAFGTYGTFMAITGILAPLISMTLPLAIVLPDSDTDALQLARICAYISASLATLLAGFIWLITFSQALKTIANISSYLLIFAPVAAVFMAWSQTCRYWLIRKENFAPLAWTTVAHSLSANVIKFVLGLVSPVAPALILAYTAGQAFHAGLIYYLTSASSSNLEPGVSRKPSTSNLNQLKTYHDFPLYRAPQDLLNTASRNLPILVLAVLFGPTSAGFYTLARLTMGLPSNLVGQSIRDTFYPRLASSAHPTSQKMLTKRLTRATLILAAVSAIPFVGGAFFAPHLFVLLFGEGWSTAGTYAQWLAPLFFLNLVNKPCVAAIPILNLNRGLLIYELASTTAKAAALASGFIIFQSDLHAIALFSLSGVVAYISLIVWILHAAKLRSSNGQPSQQVTL